MVVVTKSKCLLIISKDRNIFANSHKKIIDVSELTFSLHTEIIQIMLKKGSSCTPILYLTWEIRSNFIFKRWLGVALRSFPCARDCE